MPRLIGFFIVLLHLSPAMARPPLSATGSPSPLHIVYYTNQVGFDSRGPKIAVVQSDAALPVKIAFTVVDIASGKSAFTGWLTGPANIGEWSPGKYFYQADFPP